MKRVLFIAPVFFGYYKEIKLELENQGYTVDYFQDIPSNSNIVKALGRINKSLLKRKSDKYFENTILPSIEKNEYDYVFIIAGMTFSLSKDNINIIKEHNNDANFILYQWDGEDNISFVKELHPYFNKIYTFDRLDSEKNSKYNFLPLFYTKMYENIGNVPKNKFKYDASYIGTAHPQKLYYINEISKKTKDIFKKQYIYQYMPSKLKFIFHKLTAKEYKNVKYKDLKSEKLSSDKVMEIFEESKCIYDAPQKGQNGLTIRTIECLGAKRKLITANKDIVNYDFYNSKNIYVYDGNIDAKNIFFNCDYEEIDHKIYKKYSLRNWLRTMFKEEIK